MGSFLNSVKRDPLGSALSPGSMAGSSGGLFDQMGLTNQFQAQNQYSPQVLQNSLDQQNQLYSQQQELAKALQAQAQGGGPNPAQTQYMMNQQANTANAQGLLSGNRGLNPALAARMGSNLAAQGGQQAAQHASLLQQNQQLGAQQNLGNMYGQMQTGNLGQQNLYNEAQRTAQGLNAGVAAGNTQVRGQLIGGAMQGAGAAAGMAHGGMVNYADGGMINSSPGIVNQGGPSSMLGKGMQSSHEEKSVIPSSQDMMNFKSGGKVGGRAIVAGDSKKNDTVPAMLSPGEAVIPRSVMNSKDAPDNAAKFVAALLSKQNMKKR